MKPQWGTQPLLSRNVTLVSIRTGEQIEVTSRVCECWYGHVRVCVVLGENSVVVRVHVVVVVVVVVAVAGEFACC